MSSVPAQAIHDDISAGRAATAADIRICYALILAREAESSEVVSSRVGVTLDLLVADFIAGAEFAERVARPLLAGRSPAAALERIAPLELHDWLTGWIGTLGVSASATVGAHLAELLTSFGPARAPRPVGLLRFLAERLRAGHAPSAEPNPIREQLTDAVLRSTEEEVVASALKALALMSSQAPSDTHPNSYIDDEALVRRSALWDPDYYLAQYGTEFDSSETDPLDHFMNKGGRSGLNPHPLFSSAMYNSCNPDVASARKNPLVHYLRHGWREGRSPNVLFDPFWYKRQHQVGIEPLSDYITRGRRLGLQVHPLFKAADYLGRNPDLAAGNVDAYTHYIEYGADEGRPPWSPRRLGASLRIAVVAHVFYEELWPELSFRLRTLDRPFDLFVSLVNGDNQRLADAIRAEWPSATIVEVDNTGRDVGPFLAVLPQLMRYDVVCKLHTKKGATEPATWRLLTYEGLLGSKELIAQILGWFENDPSLVLAGPQAFYMDGPLTIDANHSALTTAVRHALGYDPVSSGGWGFFAGTMFWFRPSLFRNLPRQALLDMLRDDDNIANDGQAAHALERLFGLTAALVQGSVGLIDVSGPLPPVDLVVVPAASETSRVPLGAFLSERRVQLAHTRTELQKHQRRSWLAPRRREPGVNFIGPVEAVSGLGVSARGFVRGLQAAAIPVNVVPWSPGFDRLKTIPFKTPPCDVQPISIAHLNLDLLTTAKLLNKAPLSEWVSPGHYSIAIVYWELQTLLPEWREALGHFDEVWCASSFTQRAVAASSDMVTRVVRPVVDLAKYAHADACRTLDPEDRFVFLYSADAGSVLNRKNPQAFWRAYAKEFRPEDGATCVVKLTYADLKAPLVQEIMALAAARSDVRFIPEILSREEMAALFRRADCYVSPHRSEGLGLTLLEAMEAGKPVVSTRYGGVSDFVSEETAFIVDHELVEVGADAAPYPQGYVWAQPIEASLRARMRQAMSDPIAARAVALRGRARVNELFGEREAAAVIAREIDRIWRRAGGSSGLTAE